MALLIRPSSSRKCRRLALVVGRGWDGTQLTAFVWTIDGGLQVVPAIVYLPFLPWDGTVSAGYTTAAMLPDEAYIWPQDMGPLGIGTVGGRDRSEPSGISADDSMIVGWSTSDSPGDNLPDRAFTWDWTHGMRTLPKPFHDISAGAWGVSLDGAVLTGGVTRGAGISTRNWYSGVADSNLN